MSRFNTVQHGSSRISKVVHGAATVPPRLWHGSSRFIPDHQTGMNRHLKPGQWERGKQSVLLNDTLGGFETYRRVGTFTPRKYWVLFT